MSPRLRIVALVCIAVFALTAITGMPAFALLDAETPVEHLFGTVTLSEPTAVPDVALPAAPSVDVHSPRPPPAFQHS
jgi:hypothetical protein